MKKAVVLPFSILALSGLYIYVTPYITIYQLSVALHEKSAEKIEPFIDFPSVRDSVRSQVMEYVENEVEKTNELDPSLKEFSSSIINSISGMYIDSKIRSKNLEKWLDGERLFNEADNLDLSVDGIKESYAMGYIDPNRFAIETNGDNSIKSIQLERSNIVNWKITSIGVQIESNHAAQETHRGIKRTQEETNTPAKYENERDICAFMSPYGSEDKNVEFCKVRKQRGVLLDGSKGDLATFMMEGGRQLQVWVKPEHGRAPINQGACWPNIHEPNKRCKVLIKSAPNGKFMKAESSLNGMNCRTQIKRDVCIVFVPKEGKNAYFKLLTWGYNLNVRE